MTLKQALIREILRLAESGDLKDCDSKELRIKTSDGRHFVVIMEINEETKRKLGLIKTG